MFQRSFVIKQHLSQTSRSANSFVKYPSKSDPDTQSSVFFDRFPRLLFGTTSYRVLPRKSQSCLLQNCSPRCSHVLEPGGRHNDDQAIVGVQRLAQISSMHRHSSLLFFACLTRCHCPNVQCCTKKVGCTKSTLWD